MEYRFNVPRSQVEATRRAIQSPAFRESLRLREALGYLPGDRAAIVETAPALLLSGLTVSTQGAAVATLEVLGTLEGQIVRCLADRLDSDEYSFTLHRAGYSRQPVGLDFALAPEVTRARLRHVMRDVFSDAEDIAQALINEPGRQPTPRQPQHDNGMIGQELIDRVRAQERREADTLAQSRAQAEYARQTGGGDESTRVQYL